MKAFFKSHTGAMVVMTAVILLSVLLGSHRSLTAERAKVEAIFYQGDGSGYSIAADLNECLDITANLLTVAGRYLEENALAKLEGSRNMLADWHGITSAHSAYDRLMEEAEAVLDELERQTLTEKDAEYVQGFRTDLAARADTIARDPYNQAAEAFNERVLGAFPASLLGRLTFVREAEVFAAS